MSSVPAPAVRPLPRPGRGVLPHLPFLILEGILLAALVTLSLLVAHHPGPFPGDVGIERSIQQALLPLHALTAVIEAVSASSWPIPATITIAIVVAIFLLLRRWLDIIMTIAIAAVTDETSYLLNQDIHRPRPHGHGIVVAQVLHGTYSFPSGHVTYAVAVFGLWLYLSTQVRQPVHPALIGAIRVVLVALILLMPVSRMLEGEHWPSDVLGGALYGAFFLVLGTHVYLWLHRRWPGRRVPPGCRSRHGRDER